MVVKVVRGKEQGEHVRLGREGGEMAFKVQLARILKTQMIRKKKAFQLKFLSTF